MGPKAIDAGRHPKIELLTFSEVEAVSGYVGNFSVTIRMKARYVYHTLCNACGECEKVCPTRAIDFVLEARRRFRILVVDDELVVRDSLKEWLEDEGFQVDMAESGAEAVEKVTKENFHLMLLDIKMPGMDGVDRSPYRLSEGEKKRVALASILAMRPQLLVLDEPTSGQDGRFRETLASVFGKLEDRGFTILIATHDLDFAKATADRWIVLHEGRVVADGSPQNLLADDRLIRLVALPKPESSWQ